MRRISALCAAAGLSAIVLGGSVRANDQFLNINFDGDTLGQAPATDATASPPITKPYALGGYLPPTPDPGDSPPLASEGTILVGNTTGISKGAVMTSNSTNGAQGALYMDTQFGSSVVHDQIVVSFDLNVATAAEIEDAQVLNVDGGSHGMVFGMNDFTSLGRSFGFAAVPESGSGGVYVMRASTASTPVTGFFSYGNGDTHHIELDVDYADGTLDAFVDGVEKLTDAPLVSGAGTGVQTQEIFSFLNGEVGTANSVVVDNLNAVPEPASLSLLAGGAILMLRRRKQK